LPYAFNDIGDKKATKSEAAIPLPLQPFVGISVLVGGGTGGDVVKLGVFGPDFPDRPTVAPILKQTTHSIRETLAVVDENRTVRRHSRGLVIDYWAHSP
jgi:hypothetical protein